MADNDFSRMVRYQDELPPKEWLARAWRLLQEYSGIPEDEIEPHVRRVRDQAFAVFNYPCLGRWRFLDLYITTHPQYPELLSRLGAGEKLLDAGCCVGQVLRQLAHDGAPAENLAGLDLRQEFIDLGYDLFRDRDRFTGARFVAGDILDPDDAAVASLDGSVDVIHAASFFHLFGWDDQVAIGTRFVRFFRRAGPGNLVLGRQAGTPVPVGVDEWRARGDKRYLHNQESMQRLWDVIGERTGTRWQVEATLVPIPDVLAEGEQIERTLIRYVVRGV